MNARALLLLATALSAGCDPAPAPSTGFAGLGEVAAGFSAVERGRTLAFPADHGAHHGYRVEWWYVTANLRDEQGRDWGVQWTLFRSALRPGDEQPGWESPNLWLGHAGLTGPAGHQFAERLARGGIGQAGVAAQPFDAWIDDWSLRSTGHEGVQQLQVKASGKDFRYSLELVADGPLLLHGEQGYSEKSGQGRASYYYSQPFYRVRGEIERAGQRYRVSGQAWLDREWSSQPLAAEQRGWDWFSLHLDGGAKLMLFQVRQTEGQPYRAGTWIDANGRAEALHGQQIQLTPLTSTELPDGRKVPTRWRVHVPARGIDVEVEALQPRAWMGTTPPYWEGPVRVRGGPGGRGYLEMTGY